MLLAGGESDSRNTGSQPTTAQDRDEGCRDVSESQRWCMLNVRPICGWHAAGAAAGGGPLVAVFFMCRVLMYLSKLSESLTCLI